MGSSGSRVVAVTVERDSCSIRHNQSDARDHREQADEQ
jgi:hypothetical protein